MRRFRNLFSRRRLERDLHRELQYHLDRRIADLLHSGLTPADARREAALEFGGIAQVQEKVRDVWFSRRLHNLARDARHALRGLAASPGFTATAVLSLALGIGANTAIFGLLHALVLRSLPVADPQSLVVITRDEIVSSPYPLYVHLRDHSRTLSGTLAFRGTPVRFSQNAETERIAGALVSGTYFSVLGVTPALGTDISPEDDRLPGSGGSRGPVAVLSYAFWQRRFGGQPAVLGSRVLLNDHPFTVVGIAPPGFTGTEVGEPVDVFAPMAMQEAILPGLGPSLSLPRSQWLRIFGRLQPGVTLAQSEAELTGLLRRYNQDVYGDQDPARRHRLSEQKIVLLPGNSGISQLRKQYSRPLCVLIAVVGLVLLIACANVASLLLSRAAARRREIAIRLSLGAARSRLVSQVFTESLLLALAGAVSGLLLAVWMRNVFVRYLPEGRSLNAPIESGVLLFTLVLCVGSALVFGLAPAVQSTAVNVTPALKGGAMDARPGRFRLRQSLVVLQISLSFLLLIGAALFLRSLHNLLTIDPGFARQNILVASVQSGPGLDSRLLPALQSLPGVVSAALADSPPLGAHTNWPIYVPGYTPSSDEPRTDPTISFVSPGYFAAMGIPLLLGRDIDTRDYRGAREVMVINQTFARHYFGDRNPIGQHIGTKDGVYSWEIIGVVKDGKYSGLREGPTSVAYVPSRPGPWASNTVIHLRTIGNPTALVSALRQAIRDLDQKAALFNIHTVQEELDASLLQERLVGAATGMFGALALALAAIGLYGLISWGVARRTREFGIRIAVGAGSGSILRLVLAEASWLLAAGVAVGLGASWALARLVRSMLYGIQPADPLSALLAIAVLAAAAFVAAWIPARRASRVDPMRALS